MSARTADAPIGTVVLYRGERYISRGSAEPGKVTIRREDNPRSWRVVNAADLQVTR